MTAAASTARAGRGGAGAAWTKPLDKILNNRCWLLRERPFPHFVAQDVFVPAVYDQLAGAFQELIDAGTSETPGRRLAKGMRGYDAYGVNFAPAARGPFRLFASRRWHDLIANVTGVEGTGHMMCGVHHHAVGSSSGKVHNDLNPGWFVDSVGPDGVTLARHGVIDYGTGALRKPGFVPRPLVRAVAMLFYLNNRPWHPGDGGETGLYQSSRTPVDQPVARVPPINNSLLIFECTPTSFHTFISNTRHPRNTVILWLHRPRAEAVSRFGREAIVEWPRRR